MSRGRGLTAVVAVLLCAVGFGAGAGGLSWWTRDQRALPWRDVTVDHTGTKEQATRTRVLFQTLKLPLAAIELTRSAGGAAELGRVEVRGGAELTVRYDTEDDRPSALLGPDGARALLSFGGTKVRVTLLDAAGREVGDKVLSVPVDLQPALRLAATDVGSGSAAWAWLGWLIPEAAAQEKEEDVVTVRRDVVVQLDVTTPGEATTAAAEVDASCAPLTCLPAIPDVQVPGAATVRVAVTGTAKRSTLKAPPDNTAPDMFRDIAAEEAATANAVMRQLAGVVAAVGLTASACRSLGLELPVCVPGFDKDDVGPAALAISQHREETEGRALNGRALALYYEDQARASLDAQAKVEVCLSRAGFARTCTVVDARPFAEAPPEPQRRALALQRGLAGALEGSFVMTQNDGGDCKFSPAPKATGTLRLTFDSQTRVMTGQLNANERGSRSALGCSLGIGDMRWSVTYNATVKQTFTPAELAAGSKLTLRLRGPMTGTGTYGWSNCRSHGGVSGACPGGKTAPFSYPVEVLGTVDVGAQTGSGRVVVSDAPLITQGTWQVPAAGGK